MKQLMQEIQRREPCTTTLMVCETKNNGRLQGLELVAEEGWEDFTRCISMAVRTAAKTIGVAVPSCAKSLNAPRTRSVLSNLLEMTSSGTDVLVAVPAESKLEVLAALYTAASTESAKAIIENALLYSVDECTLENEEQNITAAALKAIGLKREKSRETDSVLINR